MIYERLILMRDLLANDESIHVHCDRPFLVKQQPYLVPATSVFNRIVGDRGLELAFAEFLDSCPDGMSFTKNNLAIGFKLDYAKANGDLSNDYPISSSSSIPAVW
jgi:type III restriction enzyme